MTVELRISSTPVPGHGPRAAGDWNGVSRPPWNASFWPPGLTVVFAFSFNGSGNLSNN